MEVPRLGVELEPQLSSYATATAMWYLSHLCDLHHSSWQCQIPYKRPEIESSWILVRFVSAGPWREGNFQFIHLLAVRIKEGMCIIRRPSVDYNPYFQNYHSRIIHYQGPCWVSSDNLGISWFFKAMFILFHFFIFYSLFFGEYRETHWDLPGNEAWVISTPLVLSRLGIATWFHFPSKVWLICNGCLMGCV